MTERLPSWPDLLFAMSTADPPALRGEFADDRKNGTYSVWFRPPSDWRIESRAGPLEITNAETTVLFEERGAVVYEPGGVYMVWEAKPFVHPREFSFDRGGVLRDAVAGPVGTTVAGREAWQVTISGTKRKPPVTVSIDAETGMVLEMRHDDHVTGFRSLDLGLDLDDSVFEWKGEITHDHRRTSHSTLEEGSAAIGIRIPIPHHWPDGVSVTLWMADPDTGAVSYDIDSAGRWGRVSMAPLGAELPPLNVGEDESVHEWQTATHAFKPKVFGAPFNDQELAKVIESMR